MTEPDLSIQYELGDKIGAIFRPKKTDNLKPGAEQLVGEYLELDYLWTIDEEDSPSYAGQVAWGIDPDIAEHLRLGFFWVPTEDLENMEELDG